MPMAASLADQDFESYLKRNNPFARDYMGTSSSPSGRITNTFADLSNALAWENDQKSNRNTDVANWQKTLVSPISPTSLNTPVTANGNSTNPFTAETLVRNPELAAILKKLYGDIGSLSTDPTKNQTVLQRNVKSQEVENAAQKGLTTQQADATNNAQSIADFAKTWLESQPKAQAMANTQADVLQNAIYGGGYANDLAGTRNKLALTGTANYQQAVGNVLARLAGSELGAGGVSSSNQRAGAAGEAGRLRLMLDEQLANLHRADLGDVLNRQTSAAGLPQSIIDAALRRSVVPTELSQTVAGNDQNRFAQLSQLIQNNSIYTPQTQSGLLNDQLGLYRNAAGLDPAAYYRYVKGELPVSAEGVVPQAGYNYPNPFARGSGGGGVPANFADLLRAYTQTGNTGQPAGGYPGSAAPVDSAGNPVPWKQPEQTQFKPYNMGTHIPTENDAYAELIRQQIANEPSGGYSSIQDYMDALANQSYDYSE